MSNSVVIANLSVNDVDLFIKKRNCQIIFENVVDPVLKLPKRILSSFLPPINHNKQYLFTDYVGPTVSTLMLISLLQYGFNCKSTRPFNITAVNAIPTVLIYYVVISLFIFASSRVVQAKLKISDVATLVGYSFYGCIFTLFVPFLLKILQDYVFYISLILFGGLSGIRMLMILLFVIDMPVARLLICSVFGNMHVLFLIYLYYFYIHPTYTFR